MPRFLLPVPWALLLVVLVACGGKTTLTGTELKNDPAPDFTLTDQRGQPLQLSSLRGNAVVLTFIYTNCPDVCPLIAEHLRAAYEQLPQVMRDNVDMLAVTVDPERDNQQALANFSQKHGLADNPHWHALTGDRAMLEPIWANYFISSESPATEHQHDHSADSTSTPTAEVRGTPTPSPDEIVDHTDAIFLIDAKGDRRVLMRSDADPKSIADNLKALSS